MAYWLGILMLIDTWQTLRILQQGEVLEVNPLTRFVYEQGGLWLVLGVKTALAICVPLAAPIFVECILITVYSVLLWHKAQRLWTIN